MQPSHILHRCLESRHPPCALSFLTGNLKTILGFNFICLCLQFLPTHLQRPKDPKLIGIWSLWWNSIIKVTFFLKFTLLRSSSFAGWFSFRWIKKPLWQAGSRTAQKLELSWPLVFRVNFYIHTDSSSIYKKNQPSSAGLNRLFIGFLVS